MKGKHQRTSSKQATNTHLRQTSTNHYEVLFVEFRIDITPSIAASNTNGLLIARDGDRVHTLEINGDATRNVRSSCMGSMPSRMLILCMVL